MTDVSLLIDCPEIHRAVTIAMLKMSNNPYESDSLNKISSIVVR